MKQGPFQLYFIQRLSLLSIASFTKHFLLLLLFFPERIFAKILCRTRGKNRKIFPAFTQFYHDCMLCYVQKPEERSSLCTGPIFPPARNRFSVRWTCVAGIRSGGQRHSGCSSAFPERSPPGGSPSTKTLQAKLKSPRNTVFRGL